MACEPQRRLAAELGHDSLGLLAVEDGEHLLGREWLEVEAVGGVVVGRDRLRVAVDHHRLVAERAERLHGVDAAVVELDPLADPVRARADDHDARLRDRRQGLVLLAPGRVVVVRARLDLAGARVDAPVGRPDALGVAGAAHVVAARPPRRPDRVVAPAGPLGAEDVERRELAPRMGELLLEPGMHALGDVVERRPGRRRAGIELARAEALEEGLGEGAADAHRLADRLHLRAERGVGAGELLEGEARELDDDVVERRLEARGRRLGEVVRDLVERVADRELRRDLRDRVARRLRGEGRGARDARVHLDHPDVPGLAAAGELDVGAAGLDADRADDLRPTRRAAPGTPRPRASSAAPP